MNEASYWFHLSCSLLVGALKLGGLVVPLLPNQREDDEDGRDAWKVKSSIINHQRCIAFKIAKKAKWLIILQSV